MIVLGLDPSLTSYGWAVHDTEASGESRCLSRGTFKSKSKDLFVLRNMMMRDSLTSLVKEVKPDKVSVEYPIFGETASEGMYGLFLFTCEALYTSKVDLVVFNVSQVKAYALRMIDRPSGYKMSKEDVKEAAEKDTGIQKSKWKKSDESDAYIISLMGGRFWKFLSGEIAEKDLSKYERSLFLEVRKPKSGLKAGFTIKKGIALRENDRYFIWRDRGDE